MSQARIPSKLTTGGTPAPISTCAVCGIPGSVPMHPVCQARPHGRLPLPPPSSWFCPPWPPFAPLPLCVPWLPLGGLCVGSSACSQQLPGVVLRRPAALSFAVWLHFFLGELGIPVLRTVHVLTAQTFVLDSGPECLAAPMSLRCPTPSDLQPAQGRAHRTPHPPQPSGSGPSELPCGFLGRSGVFAPCSHSSCQGILGAETLCSGTGPWCRERGHRPACPLSGHFLEASGA